MHVQVELIAETKAMQGPIYCLRKLFNEPAFLSGSASKRVSAWETDNLKPLPFFIHSTGSVYAISPIPEYQFVAIGTAEGLIHFVDWALKKEVKAIQLPAGIFSLLWIPEQQSLLASTATGEVYFISAPEWILATSLALSKAKIRDMHYNPRFQEVAIASSDGFIFTVDIQKRIIKQHLQAHTPATNCIQYDLPNNQLISGGRDAHLNYYERINDKWQLHKRIPAHNFAIYQLCMHPKLPILATASRDKTVKLWDSQGGTILKRLDAEQTKGHLYSVNALSWLDETHLASSGDDGLIKVWKISVNSPSAI